MSKDKAPADRRTYVALPLAQLIPGLTRAAYRKKSPAGALLMSEWALIVGARLAAETEPRRLAGGQLTIACAGPMAMELQHLSASLIDRINTHAGHKLVERLRFVQDRVAAAPAASTPRHVVATEPVQGVPPGPLHDALARLRAAIRSR
jgi:hypothetical protein